MLIDHMKRTFAERCRKNPQYSLRAFSRSLGMDSSTVSSIMNGKRPLTIKSAKKIVRGLDVANPVEAQALISETFADHDETDDSKYVSVPIETAEAIAFWQHHAIMAVLEVKDFKSTDRNIGERLAIPHGIVLECLDRLEKLEMIRRKKIGWELTGKNLTTPNEVPSSMIREGHRQYIYKALHSLDNDPIDVRDVSGITMAVSKTRLKAAKKMIQDFRRKISTFMEDGSRDAVYRLNVQLYPLTLEKTK